jgi:hypothetical protein
VAKSLLKEGSDTWKYAYTPNEDSPETLSDSEKKRGYKRFIDGVIEDFYETRNDERDFSPKVTDDELENIIMQYAEIDDDIFYPEFLESNKKVVDMIVKDVQDELGTPDFEYEGLPREPIREDSSYDYVNSFYDNQDDDYDDDDIVPLNPKTSIEDFIYKNIKNILGSKYAKAVDEYSADWNGIVWLIQEPNIYLFLGDDELLVLKRDIVNDENVDEDLEYISSDEKLINALKKAKRKQYK